MVYVEKRSKHALAVDRGIQAKKVHDTKNKAYAQAPNKTDADEYDTKGKTIPPPEDRKPRPKRKTEKKEEKPKGEYIPTNDERKKLVNYFDKNNNMLDKHKDLLTSKSVIRDKKDVKKWKNNPKKYDIRGVDTKPKGLISGRIETARQYANIDIYTPKGFKKGLLNENIKTKKVPSKKELSIYPIEQRAIIGRRLPPHSLGAFIGNRRHNFKVIKLSNRISININKSFSPNRTVAHEIGHAIDSNKRQEIGFDIVPTISKQGRKDFNLSKKISDSVSNVLSTKISPYDKKKHSHSRYGVYREGRDEQFADWFSGYITKKNVVKKGSRGFYNVFKKRNPELHRKIKKSDFDTTKNFIKQGKKGLFF